MICPALPDLLSALYAPFRHARPPYWLEAPLFFGTFGLVPGYRISLERDWCVWV